MQSTALVVAAAYSLTPSGAVTLLGGGGMMRIIYAWMAGPSPDENVGVGELQGLQLLKFFTAADTPPASPGKLSVESVRDAAVLVDFTILNIDATTVMVTDHSQCSL